QGQCQLLFHQAAEAQGPRSVRIEEAGIAGADVERVVRHDQVVGIQLRQVRVEPAVEPRALRDPVGAGFPLEREPFDRGTFRLLAGLAGAAVQPASCAERGCTAQKAPPLHRASLAISVTPRRETRPETSEHWLLTGTAE